MNSYMHPLVNKGAKNDKKLIILTENALKSGFFPKKDEQEKFQIIFFHPR